jgi:hypothetical protein
MTPCAECGAPYPPAALVAGACLGCLYGPAGPWARLEELHLLAPALAQRELRTFHAYTRRPTGHHLRAWRDARATLQDNQDEYAALYAAWCASAPAPSACDGPEIMLTEIAPA